MIVNEISLVIQKIFSVKQPKDQRFKAEDKILPVKILIMLLIRAVAGENPKGNKEIWESMEMS